MTEAQANYDAVEILDGLGVANFSVAGHDWGANMAGMLAAGWPDRVDRIAMLSSPPALGGLPPPNLRHARLQWYHWFQAAAVPALVRVISRRVSVWFAEMTRPQPQPGRG